MSRLRHKQTVLANNYRMVINPLFQRIAKNFLLLFATGGVAMLFNLLSLLLNAKALGKDGVGSIAMYQSAALMFGGIFSLGTHQPVIRLGSALQDSPEKFGRLVSLSFALDQFAAAVAGSSFLIATLFFGLLDTTPPDVSVAIWFYLALVLSSGTSCSLGTLRLFNQFQLIGFLGVISAVSIFLFSIIFWAFGAPLLHYLLAYSIVLCFYNLSLNFLSWLTLKKRGYRFRLKFSELICFEEKKRYAEFIFASYFAGTVDIIVRHIDVLALGRITSTADAGVYAVGKQIVAGMNKLLTPISTVMFPELSALAADRNVVLGKKIFKATSLGLALIGVAGCAMVFLGGGQLLHWIFSSSIPNANSILMLTFLAFTFKLGVAILAGFLVSFGRPRANFVVYAIAGLGYLLAVFPLVNVFGSLGAAAAQLVYGTLLLGSVVIAIISSLKA